MSMRTLSDVAASRRRRRSTASTARSDRIVAVLAPIGLLVIWEIASRTGVLDMRFFPPPTLIVSTLVDTISSGELVRNTLVSLRRLVIGFVVGGVPALLLGLTMGLYRPVRLAAEPVIAALYPIPKTAIFPLLLLIFGLGEGSKVAVVAVGVFFPIVINTAAGVLGIERIHHDVASNFHASAFQRFRRIALPGALPLILAGVRLAVGMALMLIVLAEMLGGRDGLGFMIWNAWQTFAVERMYVALVVVSALGVVFTLLLKEFERIVVPWRTSR
ncbi:MAG: taurine ABC transporter permease [Pseudonocardia sp. SCN 72-86]|nr:MAG: taurine ABC transporter permease [Pseudonocardia sp. SCN 72-86]